MIVDQHQLARLNLHAERHLAHRAIQVGQRLLRARVDRQHHVRIERDRHARRIERPRQHRAQVGVVARRRRRPAPPVWHADDVVLAVELRDILRRQQLQCATRIGEPRVRAAACFTAHAEQQQRERRRIAFRHVRLRGVLDMEIELDLGAQARIVARGRLVRREVVHELAAFVRNRIRLAGQRAQRDQDVLAQHAGLERAAGFLEPRAALHALVDRQVVDLDRAVRIGGRRLRAIERVDDPVGKRVVGELAHRADVARAAGRIIGQCAERRPDMTGFRCRQNDAFICEIGHRSLV